jgi:dihydrofolate synthase/folylpolyglutamate synthase
MTNLIECREDAIAFLDVRIGSGVKPGLERIGGLMELMGDPHLATPVVHVAGTNGKTTTVRLLEGIFGELGLTVGAFTSPHLERIEERFTLNGTSLSEDAFVQAVADVAPFVELFEEREQTTVTYFELTAAIAFAAFNAVAADVAVIEVGLGGRLDATNVVNADVSVITGIAMDHMSYLGNSLSAIATEKVGILKENGVLVTGLLPAAAEGSITARVVETSSRWIRRGEHYDVASVSRAVGGWLADLRGIYADYEDVFLPLHGRHQVDHLATALAAVETFFGRAVEDEIVRAAAGKATSPGRIEVLARHPLVLVDGAHNEEGITGLATALAEEFLESDRVLVVGFRGERDPVALLEPLRGLVSEVIATAPADPAALPAAEVAAAAVAVFGAEMPVEAVTPVAQAITEALDRVGPDGAVVVSGSLYVVGEARARFQG